MSSREDVRKRSFKLRVWDKCKEYVDNHVGRNGMRHLNPTHVRLGTDYQDLCDDSDVLLNMYIEWVGGNTIEVYNSIYG